MSISTKSTSMMEALFEDRRRVWMINFLIFAVYVVIFVAVRGPWVMFSAILLVAVAIRCVVLIIGLAAADTVKPKEAALFIGLNLGGGLLFTTFLVAGLWWFVHGWPGSLGVVKVLVAFIEALVILRSMFPLPPALQTSSPND